jgi:hypothetical protein
MHSSTQKQAITFAAFREKRDDLIAAAGNRGGARPGLCILEAEPVDLGPDRLAPRDNVSSFVDVFIGQHGDFPVLEKHPLITALEAARGKLIVLEALLPFPVPAPMRRYPDRQWARVRVALRDADDIRRLTEFLHKIYVNIVQPADTDHVVAVQADPTVCPRNIGDRETPGSGAERRTGPGEGAGDLYIPAGSIIWDEDPRAATWWMVASCAPARSNIESGIIQQLPFDKSRFQLAHLNYALLHGMAVAIILLHDTNGSAHGAPIGRTIRRGQPARAGYRDADWDQPGVVIKARVSLDGLGPFQKCQLLHIRFRWQDRPGAFLDVLDALDANLCQDPPAIRPVSRSMSYARLYIATGRIADGDLTVRVHVPAGAGQHGNQLLTEQLARRISAAAALEASAARHSRDPRGYLDGWQSPVIRIDLLGQA